MIRAVLDTNVLASGFVRPEPAPGQLLLAWQARAYALVVSEHILAELTRTFREPYFGDRLTPEQQAENIALVCGDAAITAITAEVHGVATHSEDDLTLATAVSAEVEYLVTGDKRLQQLRAYRGVTIVSPREFLQILESHQPE